MDVVERVNPALHCQLLAEAMLEDFKWPKTANEIDQMSIDQEAWSIANELHCKLSEETSRRISPLLLKTIVADLLHPMASDLAEELREDEEDDDDSSDDYADRLEDAVESMGTHLLEEEVIAHAQGMLKAAGLRIVVLKGLKREVRKKKKRFPLALPPSGDGNPEVTFIADAIRISSSAGWLSIVAHAPRHSGECFLVCPHSLIVVQESVIEGEAERVIPFSSNLDGLGLLYDRDYQNIDAPTEIDALVRARVLYAAQRARFNEKKRKRR